jgi:hypothetical protein
MGKIKPNPTTMRILQIIVALAIITTTFSCSDYARLERKEDRLIGAWEFDKAFYRGHGQIFRDNVIDQFNGDIIEFYEDYTAIYDDYSEGIVYAGEWELFFDRQWEGDDTDIEFFLDMYFFDPYGQESFAYFTCVNLITRNKLHVQARTRHGLYTFKFRRS